MAKGLATSEADRKAGVVYLDSSLQASPATHALVIGVGQYASNRLSPVSSPPIAARMMAEWFLDGTLEQKPSGFDNPAKPLGSLSVLLSELPVGSLSHFADGPVPRATFDNVKNAVRAWVERARSHPENFLFLFVSSHGESFGRRTAFLLEDYGTDSIDVTAGMSEIEQFVESLANVDTKQQLLIFDCCRTPTSLGLRFDQEFGARLINLPAVTDGRMRRAHVLRSTALGAEAYGRKDGPTVFTQALLDALRGLAASPNDNWAIDNFGLARTVARLLDLHVRNGEPLQQPDSQLNAPFVISAVSPINTATVFVSLGPHHDFSGCRIRVMDGQAVVQEVVGADGVPPFARLELPKYGLRTIAALDAAGAVIGQTQIEPVPPVAFKELPEQVRVTRSAGARGGITGSGKGRIVLSVTAPKTSVPPSFVATLTPSGSQPAKPVTIALPANREEVAVEIEPGWYAISLGASDGRTLSSEVQVKAGVTATVKLQLPEPNPLPSPPAAGAEMVVVDQEIRKFDATLSNADARVWLKHLGASDDRIVGTGLLAADVLVALIPPSFQQVLAQENGAPPLSPDAIAPVPVEFIGQSRNVFKVQDNEPRRFPHRTGAPPVMLKQADQPVWAAAVGEGWREIAAIPSLGIQGEFQYDATGEPDDWIPTLVVEPTPGVTGSHIAVVVNTRQWAGLLAFLARRDFERSAIVLEALVGEKEIRNALLHKIENPLAAIAGALVAVATGRLHQLKIPEQWLGNLTNWFPQLPDGPVTLARYLMSLGGLESRRAEVKSLLLDAYRRGVPTFSLSVDWLAQGLADFANDPDVAGPAKTMRRFAQLCDPARAFTVLRVPV
jgi:caspase domain-containing protein